jgi:hypothetical protein
VKKEELSELDNLLAVFVYGREFTDIDSSSYIMLHELLNLESIKNL